MACMTMFAPAMAMATTELTRVISNEEPWWMEINNERSPLRMNWVVVTDENGNRKLAIEWVGAVALTPAARRFGRGSNRPVTNLA